MKYTLIKHLIVLALVCLPALPAQAQSTAFTYQGRLTASGAPANGIHDFQFTLFGEVSGGSPNGSPLNIPAVDVTDGLFTAQLNFGGDAFSGADRWLDIAVRPAGSGAFTTLSPRQPITPAPFALTALNVPGVSGNSLHSANSGPLNVVVVDNSGKVGVGTASPASQFHVTSKPNEALPPRLQSTGNNSFNAGWDFYHGNNAKGYVGVPDVNAPVAPGELVLFGGAGTKTSIWAGQSRALTANATGNIGIGTETPAAKLDVRGDIRLGSSGQFRATSSEENLRIVRGLVNADGGVLRGTGFQVARNGVGYAITLDTPFSGGPVVTSSVDLAVDGGGLLNGYAVVDNATAGSFEIFIYSEGGAAGPEDRAFHFIAIGPR